MRRGTGHHSRALASVLAAGVMLCSTALSAAAEPPPALTGQITDSAQMLNDRDAVEDELDVLADERQLQLFVVYVDSFDGTDPQKWAQQTFARSGLGGNDVLLAVAVTDRRYATWATRESGVDPDALAQINTTQVEPQLKDDDWDGAAIAAARGLGEEGDAGLAAAIPAGIAGLLFLGGGFYWWRTRRAKLATASRGAPSAHEAGAAPATTDELRGLTASALVDVDNAIRSSSEELTFAQAQFGEQATQQFSAALAAARSKADEAFAIQQQLDIARGAGRLTEPEERAQLSTILTLTSQADAELDAQEAEFTRLRNLEAEVPQFLAGLRTRAAEITARVPVAEQELTGLGATHPSESLTTLSSNIPAAKKLIESAIALITTGEGQVATGDRPSAVSAARAAEEALGQASSRLEAVLSARAVLDDAVTAIDAALASISADLADVDRLQATDQVTAAAVTEAQRAVDAGTAARAGGDLIAALSALERAEHYLDNALLRYRAEDERVTEREALLDRRFTHISSRISVIENDINNHRGGLNVTARSHIHEAARQLRQAEARRESDPDATADHLTEAEALADRAAEELRFHPVEGMYGGRSSGIDVGSLILGGILLGGFGDRGGGWGGSSGGFGGGDFGGGFGGGGAF